MAKHGSAAKSMFYYLLSFVALSFTAIGLGQILFQIINSVFPETTYYYNSFVSQEVLRFGISSVIVAAPIYWVIAHVINKDLAKGDLSPQSAVRKWLTYLILFVSSITVLGLLVAVLNSFLNGEITVKFVLKALTILVISSFIFLYYFYDIRREEFKPNKISMSFKLFFLLLVTGTVIAGFFFVDLPSEVRARRQDEERVNRLRNITYQVDEYYRLNQKLPQFLSDLGDRTQPSTLKDPVTEEPFVYKPSNNRKYQLCANFELSNKEEAGKGRTEYWSDPDYLHDAGEKCFDKEVYVDPNLRKPM